MKTITIDLDKFLKMYYSLYPNSTILSEIQECEIKQIDCDECMNFCETCNKCIHNKFASDYFEEKVINEKE